MNIKTESLPKGAIYPVILSGGSGTRLWPLSVPSRPKQFIPLIGSRSMMQETLARTASHPAFAKPIIVSSVKHDTIVFEQLEEVGTTAAAIFLEPMGRNTAAAIALPALWLMNLNPDALMLVMPSDHVIADLDAFHRAIETAIPAARSGRLITFGIQPTAPETGYGYIERGDPLADMTGVFALNAFTEKPPLEIVEQYLASGRHFWNGGIFLFSVRDYLRELELHATEVFEASKAALASARVEGVVVTPDAESFAKCPDLSVDYAVMEKTAHAAVIPVDMGWSDVGSWDALWAVRERDGDGNSSNGASITIDGEGNLIYVDGGPPVAILGIRNSVIVSTQEAVLVLPRARAQDVKAIVDRVKAGDFAG